MGDITVIKIGKRKNRSAGVSAEGRAKIAATHKGKIVSAETRAKMSASRKGRVLTDEWRAKLSKSLTKSWQLRKDAKQQ